MKKFMIILIPLFFIINCSTTKPDVVEVKPDLKRAKPVDISECVKPEKLKPTCNTDGMPRDVEYFKQLIDCTSTQLMELSNYSRDLKIYSQCLEDVVKKYNEEITHKFIFSEK